jgi:DNA-binding YbaB/EbfC family protein
MDINPFDILKNAQKIQEQMGSFQEKLAAINATGSSGGGVVEIDINGKFEVSAVRISPELMESGDTEMLEDLIVAAFSNGHDNIKEKLGREIGAMAGGFGIPGLSGLMGAS